MKYKTTLFCVISCLITSCSFSQNKELFITANTNICPNCYGEYQLLNAFDEKTDLQLVFQNNDKKSASKFADKFFHISRPFEIICNDSLYNQLSHNTIPWFYYYENGQLVFESALTEIEFWTPYINGDKISQKILQLPDNIILSEKIRFMPCHEGFVIADFSYNEIHYFDGKWNFIKTQDFSNLDMEGFYQSVFKNSSIWNDICKYRNEIAPFVPDFGKIKIDNCCTFNDTLYLLVNVNFTEKYFNEMRNDTSLRVLNESAIVVLNNLLEIQQTFPLHFRDSMRYEQFFINAFPQCVFQINSWNEIIMSISQKSKNEKHILCRLERIDDEIYFNSLIDNAFIPEFNEKHDLGTNLGVIKVDSEQVYFNLATCISNYKNGLQTELPFDNENSVIDLKRNVIETKYNLIDAQKMDEGFLFFHEQSDGSERHKMLSFIDIIGNLKWKYYLPKEIEKVYLVDEGCILYIGENNNFFRLF